MYLAGAKIEHLQELYQHIDINTLSPDRHHYYR